MKQKSHWETMTFGNRVEHVLFNYASVTEESEAPHMEKLIGELCPFVQRAESVAVFDRPYSELTG